MKYEDGYVFMTREEIADGNIKQRIMRCIETFGPLTALEMNRICCGATLGERVTRISHACFVLKKDGKLDIDNKSRKWRINDE